LCSRAVGESAGRPWMSLAKRDGKSGTVYEKSPKQRRRLGGEGRGEDGRVGEERRGGDRQRDGLAGQMNRNREVSFIPCLYSTVT